MKFLVLIMILLFSLTSFAEGVFKASSNKQKLRSLKDCKHNHLVVLQTYKDQIDSEIDRLVLGIEYEVSVGSNSQQINGYENLLSHLLLKRIFVSYLEENLESVDLDKEMKRDVWKKILDTEDMKIDLSKEMGLHLDTALQKKAFEQNFMEDLRDRIIKSVLINIVTQTYQAIGNGLLTKVLLEGAGKAALRSALISLSSDIFTSAGKGTLYGIASFPLKGSRLPPETVWTRSLRENPELMLNPEWMTYSGNTDHPWYTHGYAFLRKTDEMEEILDLLINSEEDHFQSRVIKVSRLNDFVFKPKESTADGFSERDNTSIQQGHYVKDFAPFWASLRK